MAKRFRVAISFAGEKRHFVKELAEILAFRLGRESILYDKFLEAELARSDLASYLPKLYKDETELIVVIFCGNYPNKEWCGLEWRAIYSLVKKKADHTIMLMRFDRVEPEDLHDLAGFIELDELSPVQAARHILERLALNASREMHASLVPPEPPQEFQQPPHSPSDSAASQGSAIVIRSFPPQAPDPANLALPPLDLTDLFNDREPIHEAVWSREIPERLAQVVPTLASLPQPLVVALQTHLSIAWFLGTKLTAKAGIAVLLRQRTNTGEAIWDGSNPKAPPEASRWLMSEIELNCGDELAVVVSITRPALADAQRSISFLALPIRRVLHAEIPDISQSAITDGSHARWLVDALVREATRLVQADLPPRIHLFPACPVALAFLLGQQAEALGPTTVYEFDFNNPSRSYQPGMAS